MKKKYFKDDPVRKNPNWSNKHFVFGKNSCLSFETLETEREKEEVFQ